MSKTNIIPQMFDVRPVNATGDLDWEKIQKMENIIKMKKLESFTEEKKYVEMIDLSSQESLRQEVLKELKNIREKEECEFHEAQKNKLSENHSEINRNACQRKNYDTPMRASAYRLGEKIDSQEFPFFHKSDFIPRNNYKQKKVFEKSKNYYEEEIPPENFEPEILNREAPKNKKSSRNILGEFSFSDLFFPSRFSFDFQPQRSALSFACLSLVVAFIIGGFAFGFKGLGIKGKVLGTSQEGYSSLNSAIDGIKSQNYEASGLEFEKSYEKFSEASNDLDEMGKVFIEISKFFPFYSKLSSGKNMVEAGKHIAIAGQSLNKIMESTSTLENPISDSENQNVSLLELFQSAKKEMVIVNQELEIIQENISEVNIDDLPEEKRDQFITLKEKLPEVVAVTNDFLSNSEIFVDLLGGNGPRKYLFLFQNNQEMRATGWFIGSYGLMDIADGRIRNFFIDVIFNPDGQLQEKIIPPKPIQKISAAWSLHDSNWFPNFPISAKEAINFYEKTGGPTADGVITLTPTEMQKLLAITGPIEMKDYDVTIDADNFIEKTQSEIEVDYDKEENKPKKILSDLAPIILDKIFNARDTKSIAMTIQALSSGLSEKHILLYSENENLQKIISERGWSGEILSTQKDYLSVVNSNINGFKTDGVIDETISHEAEVQSDGSIVDTVIITRHHNGGNYAYEWWNKVNADYMRVYVPLGSKLLEVSGQTRETNNSPLDYTALGFKKDQSVQNEENGILVDEDSGTKIYEDSEKTVFANWTYVSPQETMTIKYKYLLPFKITLEENKPVNSYSLLAQKQSGSIGSNFSSSVKFPKNYKIEWSYPENIPKKESEIKIETELDVDRFMGIVFTKNNIISND